MKPPVLSYNILMPFLQIPDERGFLFNYRAVATYKKTRDEQSSRVVSVLSTGILSAKSTLTTIEDRS